MSRKLDDLSPRFRPLAIELLARLTEAGIAVMVIDTLRTPAEHAANLAAGKSWVKRSKHLDGDAIDICPYAIYDAYTARHDLSVAFAVIALPCSAAVFDPHPTINRWYTAAKISP